MVAEFWTCKPTSDKFVGLLLLGTRKFNPAYGDRDGSSRKPFITDISSGHTEIIPSQSSNSDWSDGHQAVDDDGINLPDITERFSSHESNDGSHLVSHESEGRQVEHEITSGGFILPDSVEPISGSKSVHYQGYQYLFYHGGGATRNYRCSSYRPNQCLARLYISRMGAVV
ncbi:Hypothetical protein PHPALM_525 [Phytophthora palmivora]|uniref:FLYWCH-type domain-containing protein n=1 Tax=Phytophthora palmivora TaxID=4796 RepID=A0A2P4YUL1_9STRA|nr:Hypothetical protein PHPALM_525 [Phytophthora palmivora]